MRLGSKVGFQLHFRFDPRDVDANLTRGKDGDRDTIGWTWSQDAPTTVKAKRRQVAANHKLRIVEQLSSTVL